MKKRPLSVTLLSCLLIAAGVVGLVYHFAELRGPHRFQYDILWVSLVRLIALVCGVFMLRGSDWARWLTLVWISYHVALSFFHSLEQVIVHALLLAVFAYFLLRPEAMSYFRGRGAATT
jgi:hypothetical protein